MTTFMATLPQSLIGQLFLILWLIACVAVLVIAFKDRKHHERDYDVTVLFYCLMMILTFPLGLVAIFGVAAFASLFSRYYDGFAMNLVLWVFFVAGGYIQWFIVIPWLYKSIIYLINSKTIFIFS